MERKEDELIESILDSKLYFDLPNRLRSQVTEEEYKNRVLVLCFERQLKFGKIAKLALKDEQKYYQLLERESREKMRIFPYHIQERLVAIEVPPFIYYRQMLKDNLENERSYDQLPNFTAADVLRLTGIGRNEYIELLNQARSKRSLSYITGFLRRTSSVNDNKVSLPRTLPKVHLMPWWVARMGFPSELQVQALTAQARTLLDELMDSETKTFFIHTLITREGFNELHSRGLIFIEVPVSENEHFRVPVLDGFVMNRLSGDYMESLLYKVFSTMSSQSVGELSQLLDEKVELVIDAISTLSRLGFVEKMESGGNGDSFFDFNSDTNSTSSKNTFDESADIFSNDDNDKKLGLIYDSSLAALLMMGNLSAGLKRHAVTMFEVGQLRHDQITALIDELRQIDDSGVDGQAQMYFHAGRALLLALEILRIKSKVNMLRAETLNDLPPDIVKRMISKNYSMLISMSELSCPLHLLPPDVPFVGCPGGYRSNPWMRVLLFKINAAGPTGILLPRGCRLHRLPKTMSKGKHLKVCPWDQESQIIDSSMALYYLNEALIHHPMFVYEYSKESINIPLPCTDDEITAATSDVKYITAIKNVIDIDNTVGYLSFQKFNDQNYLESISFGLPLLSLELAAKVCDRMNTIANLGNVKHERWIQELDSLTLLYGDGESEPWPAQPLYIQNGKISPFSCS